MSLWQALDRCSIDEETVTVDLNYIHTLAHPSSDAGNVLAHAHIVTLASTTISERAQVRASTLDSVLVVSSFVVVYVWMMVVPG